MCAREGKGRAVDAPIFWWGGGVCALQAAPRVVAAFSLLTSCVDARVSRACLRQDGSLRPRAPAASQPSCLAITPTTVRPALGFELDVGGTNSKGGWEPSPHCSRALATAKYGPIMRLLPLGWGPAESAAEYPGFEGELAVKQADANAAIAKLKWAHALVSK